MMNKSGLKNLVLFLFATLPAMVIAQNSLPMPPRFDISTEPREVLTNYPLGIITKQAAFAHHGQALKKFTLPNGNEGWLYKVGEKAGIPSNYILQFSNAGLVIDVLHKDHRYMLGHSALQYQYLVGSKVESRTLGPGPGE